MSQEVLRDFLTSLDAHELSTHVRVRYPMLVPSESQRPLDGAPGICSRHVFKAEVRVVVLATGRRSQAGITSRVQNPEATVRLCDVPTQVASRLVPLTQSPRDPLPTTDTSTLMQTVAACQIHELTRSRVC
jgi:hypothetical protein